MIEPSVKKPSLFRRFTMSLVSGWRRVMDVRYNPLKYVPDPSLQTYFMLVLFVAWSVFFGLFAITISDGLVTTSLQVSLYMYRFYYPLHLRMQFLWTQRETDTNG